MVDIKILRGRIKMPIKKKKVLVILGTIVLGESLYLGVSAVQMQRMSKYRSDIKKAVIIENSTDNEGISWANGLQIVRANNEWIQGKSLEQKLLWENPIEYPIEKVIKTSPYFITVSSDKRKLGVYNEGGLDRKIKVSEGVLFADVSSKGNVYAMVDKGSQIEVVVYKRKEEERASLLEVQKGSLWPVAIKTHPTQERIIMSWIDSSGPLVKSYVAVGRFDEEFTLEEVYVEKDNIIQEIQFIEENKWRAIGDKNVLEKELN